MIQRFFESLVQTAINGAIQLIRGILLAPLRALFGTPPKTEEAPPAELETTDPVEELEAP